MTKKASLNLSINAIVVLILAITMLGLGLGFMKTMFGQAVGEFENVAGEMKNRIVDELESSDERLTFNNIEIDLKRGGSKDVFFGLKNDEGNEKTFTITTDIVTDINSFVGAGGQATGAGVICFTNFEGHNSGKIMGDATNSPQIKFNTVKERFLEAGDIAVLKLNVQATSSAELSTFSCAMATSHDGTSVYAIKYFNINVK